MGRQFKSTLSLLLVASLLVNAFCAPRPRPQTPNKKNRSNTESRDNESDNDVDAPVAPSSSSSTSTTTTSSPDDDEDDDFGDPIQTQPSGGGSNIVSLINLATALFPSSSGAISPNQVLRNRIRRYLLRYQQKVAFRRKDTADNVIEVDSVKGSTRPLLRLEDEHSDSQEHDHSSHEDDEDHTDNEDDGSDSKSEENDAAEVSMEEHDSDVNDKASKQDSHESEDDENYSDEPEGDGQGGGILGLLASLSGGEEGSDLGTLLGVISQIVGDLSGDGVDLNAIIGAGFGLFVGLLSQGEENPGEVIASYFLTSLDSITGGGAQNNGAFFGKLVSKLLTGTSAGQQQSARPQSPLWTLKMDVLRAFLQFGTSILGLASSSFTTASTV